MTISIGLQPKLNDFGFTQKLSSVLTSIKTHRGLEVFLKMFSKSKNKPSSSGVFHFVSRPEKQAGDQNRGNVRA